MKMKKNITVSIAALLLACGANAQHSPKDTIDLGYGILAPSDRSSYVHTGTGSETMDNNPYIDPMRSLMGKIAGLNVTQGSGYTADNVCSLSLHGKSPLVLVDGFPRDIKHLTASEIESVYILSDACATALYGVRGSNGIVMVTTRHADAGPLKVRVGYQIGVNTQFRSPESASALTYAETVNTALKLDGSSPRYSEFELNAYRTGKYPYAYPDVDWWNEVYDDMAFNHRANLSFEGGSRKFRYYTVVDYMYDSGFFRQNRAESRYDQKQRDVRLNARTNLDIMLTRTTTMKLGLLAKFSEANRANFSDIYNILYNTPSNAFPVKHHDGVYGGTAFYKGNNPVALLNDTGNYSILTGTINADLRLTQDLGILTEGLLMEAAIAFDNVGAMQESATKTFTYRELSPIILDDGTLVTNETEYGDGSKVVNHSSGFYSLYMRMDFQAKVAYSRTFGKHDVYAAGIFDMQSYTANGRNNSTKRLSAIATASYTYDGRYSVSTVANGSGSAYLAPGRKMVFYPAVNAAWIASGESFLKDAKGLDFLKLSASFGYSGWDGNLSHELYLQNWNVGGGSYMFADGATSTGKKEGTLSVEDLVPEKAMKTTLTLEAKAFGNRFGAYLNGFYEKRTDMLVNGSPTVSNVIGIDVGRQCTGAESWHGADLSLSWKEKRGAFDYGIYANASYLNSKVIEDGQEYQRYDYLYHKGNPVGQRYGLVTDGFFFSQKDINNTVTHTFMTVKPGDVKYIDQNGDNKITDEDIVPIGHGSIPKLTLGFGFRFGWNGIELSAEFQGRAGVSVNLLDSPLYKPLTGNTNIFQSYLDRETVWTPETSLEATMPRLCVEPNQNNYRASSLWFRSGAFLKLRDVTLSYTLPKRISRFADIKIYLKGTNLFSADALGIIDPEQMGANYPSTRSYWAGMTFNF